MYDKDRRPWQIIESGPESAIYRTEDGGDRWQRLGGGLPAGRIGRIGLDIYQKNPAVLYALIENQNPKPGASDAEVSPTRPLASGIIGNELYRTDDGGRTWQRTSDVNVAGGKAPYSFKFDRWPLQEEEEEGMAPFLSSSLRSFPTGVATIRRPAPCTPSCARRRDPSPLPRAAGSWNNARRPTRRPRGSERQP